MKKLKEETVFLSALLFTLVPGALANRIVFAVIVLFVYLGTDLLRYSLSRYLPPAFQIPFILIVAATLFQVASFEIPFLDYETALFLTIPVFMFTVSGSKFPVRIRIAVEYLILSFIVILVQNFFPTSHYLAGFLSVLFGSLVWRDFKKILGIEAR